jgi:hypothetical protein
VSADDGFHARRCQAHGLGNGRQVWVPGEDELGVPAGTTQSGGGKASLGALATGKNKFAVADGQAMKFGRIIQTEEAAFHGAAGGELREHGG